MLSLNNLTECINNKARADIIVNFNSHVHGTILNNGNIIACNNNYDQFFANLLRGSNLNFTMASKLPKNLYLF